MAEQNEFEVEVGGQEVAAPQQEVKQAKGKPQVEIEVEDDTPEEDRGRQPMPKELVDKLDQDELDQYDAEVQSKLKQAKKVYHDERREKERAAREREEALALAKQVIEENKKLKSRLSEGEKIYADTAKDAATRALEMAKAEYKTAYDAGDGDALAAAQVKITEATFALKQANDFKPTLQTEEKEVQIPQSKTEAAPLEPKTAEWLESNPWFGSPKHKAMSSFAYGVHEELLDEFGQKFNGTEEYFRRIDKAMRRTFPDYFKNVEGEEEVEDQKPQQARPKSAPVVAPASRSTAPKKVKLSQSRLDVIKKLGITPEQYATELLKLEK